MPILYPYSCAPAPEILSKPPTSRPWRPVGHDYSALSDASNRTGGLTTEGRDTVDPPSNSDRAIHSLPPFSAYMRAGISLCDPPVRIGKVIFGIRGDIDVYHNDAWCSQCPALGARYTGTIEAMSRDASPAWLHSYMFHRLLLFTPASNCFPDGFCISRKDAPRPTEAIGRVHAQKYELAVDATEDLVF